jgi:hypothetical protein
MRLYSICAGAGIRPTRRGISRRRCSSVLEGRYLDRAAREKDGFRPLFLTCLKFFVADEHDRHLYLYRPILL